MPSALDRELDRLYQLPLSEFTAARNALARTLKGDEAREVRSAAKPAVVPWSVNQLFWQARPTYERVMKAGAAVRKAQLTALKGGKADVRDAADEHRKAVADAAERAQQLAPSAGSRPSIGPLARMLEALSLAPEPPENPGRFTEAIQPAGFEALTGVPIAARVQQPDERGRQARKKPEREAEEHGTHRRGAMHLVRERAAPESDVDRRARERAAREAEAERRRQAARIEAAERDVKRTRDLEINARRSL